MPRALLLVVLVACAPPSRPQPAPAPAPQSAPAPVAAAAPTATPTEGEGRSWVGIRIEADSMRISQVIKDAPGERAGLAIGDQLVAIDGTPVTTVPAFVERVMRTKQGSAIAIEVTRRGARKTFAVTVAPRPASIAQSSLVGKPAPAFAAAPLAGPFATKLADLRGNVVVIDFWATWCVPCTLTIPKLNELHAKYEASGLRIVGLSSEEPDVIRPFVASRNIAYAIGHDPDDAIARQYLRENIPMFVIVNRAGLVQNIVVGADVDALEAAVLAQMVSSISPSSTAPSARQPRELRTISP